jgi:hypothetical protein
MDSTSRAKNKNFLKEIILECVKEVFAESIKPADEQDIRGVLGFPFDKYIVPLSIKVDDHDAAGKQKADYTYSWKLRIPVDDPELLSNLTEDQETFEEKLIETITEKLRSPASLPGGQFTTGFAEVEKRETIRGVKLLLVKVEMTVGWNI